MTDRAAHDIESDTLDAARPDDVVIDFDAILAGEADWPDDVKRFTYNTADYPSGTPSVPGSIKVTILGHIADTIAQAVRPSWLDIAPQLVDTSPLTTAVALLVESMKRVTEAHTSQITEALGDLWLAHRITEDADAGLCKPLPLDGNTLAAVAAVPVDTLAACPALAEETWCEWEPIAITVAEALDKRCFLDADLARHGTAAITAGQSLARTHRRRIDRRTAIPTDDDTCSRQPRISSVPRPNPRRIPIAANAPNCTPQLRHTVEGHSIVMT